MIMFMIAEMMSCYMSVTCRYLSLLAVTNKRQPGSALSAHRTLELTTISADERVLFHLVWVTQPLWSRSKPSTYSTLPGGGHALYHPLRWSIHCSAASARVKVDPGQPTSHAAPRQTMKSTIDASVYDGSEALRAPRCHAFPSFVRASLAPHDV